MKFALLLFILSAIEQLNFPLLMASGHVRNVQVICYLGITPFHAQAQMEINFMMMKVPMRTPLLNQFLQFWTVVNPTKSRT